MNRRHQFRTDMAFFFILLLGTGLFIFTPDSLFAAQVQATTQVRHKPIAYFVPGNRIAIDARITDESGINLVRCYFKADMQAEYVFVPMTETSDRNFRAILPAPTDDSIQIQYLFLVVNHDRQVIKTQEFSVETMPGKQDVPAWQQVSPDETLSIYTELPVLPERVAGFSDSLAIDAVESSLRFGMVAGIYSASAETSAGPITGEAASATSAGNISAQTGAYTTIGIATIAGAAAGAGIIAAVVSGDDGGGKKDRINPNARVTWGDENVPSVDAFRAIFGREDLGVALSGMHEKIGLPVGIYDLTIIALSVSGDYGNVVIDLGGGAYFHNDGSIRKRAVLAEGQSVVFPVFVPDTGDASIRW